MHSEFHTSPSRRLSDEDFVENESAEDDLGELTDDTRFRMDSDFNESSVEDLNDQANASEQNDDGESVYDDEDGHKLKPLTAKKLGQFKNNMDSTGVVYVSRIPPFMKPQKLKHLLSQFGDIGRIYLAQEDPKIRFRRIKAGGNKKRKFNEGWVEFMDKKIAKLVARSLNNTAMGGKKSNYYYDDIWNLKYLPKFKWIHLTEQLAYERQQRARRLQLEMTKAKTEVDLYLKNVDKSKMIQAMEDKKKKKTQQEMASGVSPKEGTIEAPSVSDAQYLNKLKRRFKQRRIIEDDMTRATPSPKVSRVISKLF